MDIGHDDDNDKANIYLGTYVRGIMLSILHELSFYLHNVPVRNVHILYL